MTTLRASDLIESIAAALQYISYYHPADYISHLARAYVAQQAMKKPGESRQEFSRHSLAPS